MNETALQELLDKQALLELVVRYCRATDRCDEQLLLSVYHPDAIDEHGHFVGNVREMVEHRRKHGSWRPSKLQTRVQHAITNALFEIDGDVAYGESYVEVRDTRGGEFSIRGIGRYIDRFERRDGEWRIAHRVVVLDYAGPGVDASLFHTPRRDEQDLSYLREQLIEVGAEG